MKQIKLTCGEILLVDDDKYADVIMLKWLSVTKRKDTKYCVYTKEDGRLGYLHRYILGDPSGVVDHVNRNGLDNRVCNLRKCTARENAINSKLNDNNTSGYKGVYLHKETGKWYSQIKIDNKRKHLGLFDNRLQAAKAYSEAIHRLYGEFANQYVLSLLG